MALASCCEDAAAALADAGRNDEAIALLDRGGRRSTPRAGASADIERVEAALRELGAGTKKARPVRPTFGWESLTPTEMAVSELVANGLTNPEIGARCTCPPNGRDPPRPHLPQARLRQPHPTRLRVHPTARLT